jgi:hypothetical protein
VNLKNSVCSIMTAARARSTHATIVFGIKVITRGFNVRRQGVCFLTKLFYVYCLMVDSER